MMDEKEIEEILATAGQYLENNELQNARLILEAAIHKGMKDPRLKSLLAVVYSRLDMHLEALHIYDQLIKEFPKEASLYFRKGLELFYIDEIFQGISFIQKACRLEPEEELWQKFLGLVQEIMGFELVENNSLDENDFPEYWLKALEVVKKASQQTAQSQKIVFEPQQLINNEIPKQDWISITLNKSLFIKRDKKIIAKGDVRLIDWSLDNKEQKELSLLFIKAFGEGQLMLKSNNYRKILRIYLENVNLFLIEKYLIAFEEGLDIGHKNLSNGEDTLGVMSFKGKGAVFVTVPDNGIQRFSLSEDDKFIVPSGKIIGWYGNILPQYKKDSYLYIEGIGEFFMECI